MTEKDIIGEVREKFNLSLFEARDLVAQVNRLRIDIALKLYNPPIQPAFGEVDEAKVRYAARIAFRDADIFLLMAKETLS